MKKINHNVNMDKALFLSVWSLDYVRHIIKSYMYPNKRTHNYYEYTNGDMACYYNYIGLIQEKKTLIYTRTAAIYSVRNYELLQLMYDINKHIFDDNIADETAKYGTLDCLIYLRNNNINCTLRASNLAALYGKLNIIEYLYSVNSVDNSIAHNAIIKNQIHVLDWLYCNDIHKFHNITFDTYHVLSINGNVDTIKWLYSRLPYRFDLIDHVTSYAELDFILYLKLHGSNYTFTAIQNATKNDNIRVLQWLLDNLECPYSEHSVNIAINNAIFYGNILMVHILHKFNGAPFTIRHVSLAIVNDKLDILKYITDHPNDGCDPSSLEKAAHHNYFDIIKYVHTHTSYNFTTRSMDLAAAGGHLLIVEYLHRNRLEGCTKNAINLAAEYGHLSVVEYLHLNRFEGCTTNAMDNAAANGHLSVVQYLHYNRSEGCTTNAIDNAAKNGHLNVVRWLNENRYEGYIHALELASLYNHIDVFMYLYYNGGLINSNVLFGLVKNRHLIILQELYNDGKLYDLDSLLDMSRHRNYDELSQWLYNIMRRSELIYSNIYY